MIFKHILFKNRELRIKLWVHKAKCEHVKFNYKANLFKLGGCKSILIIGLRVIPYVC